MNMKNKLLITTALVALTAVTNAYALEITEGDNILQNAYNEDLIISGGNNSVDRFGMEFGAGVTAEVNDNVELSLGYEGKFREDYQDHTGLINAKYKF